MRYKIFNYTDNIYATNDRFYTQKKAKAFIRKFRTKFKKRGYYWGNRWEKIAPKDIDLEIIPADFNPYKKSN